MDQIAASLTGDVYSLPEIVRSIDGKKPREPLGGEHGHLPHDHRCSVWTERFPVDFYQRRVGISDRIEITAQCRNTKYIKCNSTEPVTHITAVFRSSPSKMAFQTEVQLVRFCPESWVMVFDVAESKGGQYMLPMMLV